MDNILYSTGCPMCEMVKAKLDEAGIKYKLNTDQNEMRSMGFTNVPMFSVAGGEPMNVMNTLAWIKQNGDNK